MNKMELPYIVKLGAILACGEQDCNGAATMPWGSDKLVGTWKLVSVSLSTEGSERNDTPFGASPTGFLTYTREGRMSAMMSYGGRKPLSVSDWSQAAAEEKAEAFGTFAAYAGRYTLKEDRVIHHVEISSLQNWVNTDLVRLIQFQSDRIVLRTPPTSTNGKIQTWELVWERVAASS